MDNRYIIDWLASARTERNISIEEIAQALNINASAYTRYEESLGFTFDEIKVIAQVLKMSITELLNGPEIESSIIDSSKLDNQFITVNDPTVELLDKVNKNKDVSDLKLFLSQDDIKDFWSGKL